MTRRRAGADENTKNQQSRDVGSKRNLVILRRGDSLDAGPAYVSHRWAPAAPVASISTVTDTGSTRAPCDVTVHVTRGDVEFTHLAGYYTRVPFAAPFTVDLAGRVQLASRDTRDCVPTRKRTPCTVSRMR